MNPDERNSMNHETIIVRRPFDQARPICTCGWQGTTCDSVADAELEASEHTNADYGATRRAQREAARLASLNPKGAACLSQDSK
jgi:hypothetical protein